MTDEEIDLRTYLTRHLEPHSLRKTLTQQVIDYGLLCAYHAQNPQGEIVPEHPFEDSDTPNKLTLKPTASAPAPAPTEIVAREVAPWEDLPEENAEAKLSDDQAAAWTKLQRWAKTGEPYFVLRGFAGTGKTFLLQKLVAVSGVTMLFTAPTNKAAKVLGKAVGRPAKTTHSTLGLKMEQDGDTLKLTASDKPPYIPKNAILVVDEASMVGKELLRAIVAAAEAAGCKVLFVGDPAQLPPVGENMSSAWRMTDDPQCRAVLKHVMRFDNQLLGLSMKIRECLKDKTYRSPITDDHDKNGGVYLLSSKQNFERALLKGVDSPAAFKDRKVIAWRNKTVDRYNDIVRDHLGFTDPYCVGEQLMLAEPVEYGGTIIASIDDEVTITSIGESKIEMHDYEIPTWRMTVEGDVAMTLSVARDEDKLNRMLGTLADKAKYAKGLHRKICWKEFWEAKRAFHKVRYGYAQTAHRAQGSTYTTVFIDQLDILANSDKRTAFRCLYVGATRPTTALYTY